MQAFIYGESEIFQTDSGTKLSNKVVKVFLEAKGINLSMEGLIIEKAKVLLMYSTKLFETIFQTVTKMIRLNGT